MIRHKLGKESKSHCEQNQKSKQNSADVHISTKLEK